MDHPAQPARLTEDLFVHAVSELSQRDPGLAFAISRWGNPPLWTHPSGFPGLALAILSQQVSLESAQAAFNKLGDRLQLITPEGFLTLDDPTLKEIGFSRQKAAYVRGLARAIIGQEFKVEEIALMEDDPARNTMLKIKGIGSWTANAYLLFALHRPDAWPSGDLALIKAIQDLRGLEVAPGIDEADRIADGWKPWRAVAARILWHHYLSVRGRSF